MRPLRLRVRPASIIAFAISTLMIAVSASARDSDPVHLILSESLVRDDNIFRQAPAFGVSDTVATTNLRATFDTTQSRQQFHGEVVSSKSSYDNLKQLDSTTSAYQIGWLGTLLTCLKVDAGRSRNQSLSNFADTSAKTKNIVTAESTRLRLGYSLHNDWTISAQATHGTSINSAAANAQSDSKTDSGEMRLQYDSPKGNQAGLTLRRTNGFYPNRQPVGTGVFVDNSYSQEDIETNLSWAPGAKSLVTYRLARTRREQVDLPQRNFSGYTNSLGFDWKLTGATSINVSAGRDLSAQETLLASYAVVNSRGIGITWAPTAKISTVARLDQQSRTFGGDPKFVVTGSGTPPDRTTGLSFALQYALSRRIQLSMQLRHEVRKTSDPLLGYKANTATMNAQLTF